MTKKQAEADFKAYYLPNLNRSDYPLLCMTWNDYTDMLCKNGDISSNQYNNWGHPSFIKRQK